MSKTLSEYIRGLDFFGLKIFMEKFTPDHNVRIQKEVTLTFAN